jgi:putative hydrolase of the HAD superfamily
MLSSLIRAVFFDAVGTLIHPEPPAVAVYADAARRNGSRYDLATIATRFRRAFQHEEATDAANGHRTDEARELRRWRDIVTGVLDDVRDSEACFHHLYEHFADPGNWSCAAGAAEVVAELNRRGYLLGLASNFDHRLHRIADELPAQKLIHHRVISSEVGWKKPAAEFFAAMRAAVELESSQILMVGDDLTNDVCGAQAAGMEAILLAKDTSGGRPDVRCISDLKSLIDDLI